MHLKPFRKLRHQAYVGRQRAITRLAEQFRAPPGMTTIVGVGNWSAQDRGGIMRGPPPGPWIRFLRRLRRYVRVRRGEEKLVDVWDTKRCTNKSCKVNVVNRDVNGAANILMLTKCFFAGALRPTAFGGPPASPSRPPPPTPGSPIEATNCASQIPLAGSSCATGASPVAAYLRLKSLFMQQRDASRAARGAPDIARFFGGKSSIGTDVDNQSRTATGGASQEADLPQVIWHASPAGNSAAQAEEGTPSENRSPNLAMSHSSIKRRLIQASGRPTQALDPSRKSSQAGPAEETTPRRKVSLGQGSRTPAAQLRSLLGKRGQASTPQRRSGDTPSTQQCKSWDRSAQRDPAKRRVLLELLEQVESELTVDAPHPGALPAEVVGPVEDEAAGRATAQPVPFNARLDSQSETGGAFSEQNNDQLGLGITCHASPPARLVDEEEACGGDDKAAALEL
ncbi:hypothetical protein APUTEX25_005556, partial [Auxenochlorella protothecoides]